MIRRNFLKAGTLVGIALPELILAACQTKVTPDHSALDVDDFAFNEFTIDDLQRKMQAGELSARALVEQFLKRIEAIDRNGPKLNSVIEINPDARSIASALDDERKRTGQRSVLHGIPFLVKDNIDTGDRMMTTAGSLALSGHYAKADSPLVRHLREAGAVLLGKTNLSEWANFRSGRSSSGWSSRGGQTNNPYDLQRNPCGSSSGSGVAVAANLCVFAIGTETNGSISCPSSINGIVGLKPTVGLVSQRGIIPISATQDTAGPMTRTVRDAAIVLSSMTAIDEAATTTSTHSYALKRPLDLNTDYVASLDPDALKGKRIGIEKSFLKGHEKIDALLDRALSQMRSKGAEIIEVDFVSKLSSIGENEFKLLQYEFKDGLNRYLKNADVSVKNLKEVIEYNASHAESVMPYFGQDILEASEGRGDLNEEDYKMALKIVVETSRRTIDETLGEFKLDALCGPATGPSWCTDLVNGDSFSGYGMGSGAAMAGYPSVTVPMGFVHGLPVGLLFMTTAFGERELLAIAYGYEQTSRNRAAPLFRKFLM